MNKKRILGLVRKKLQIINSKRFGGSEEVLIIKEVLKIVEEQEEEFIKRLKERIQKRKWVWNEEKFGSRKARNWFNEIFVEILKEIDELKKQQEEKK